MAFDFYSLSIWNASQIFLQRTMISVQECVCSIGLVKSVFLYTLKYSLLLRLECLILIREEHRRGCFQAEKKFAEWDSRIRVWSGLIDHSSGSSFMGHRCFSRACRVCLFSLRLRREVCRTQFPEHQLNTCLLTRTYTDHITHPD